jgi:hypothetical protein
MGMCFWFPNWWSACLFCLASQKQERGASMLLPGQGLQVAVILLLRLALLFDETHQSGNSCTIRPTLLKMALGMVLALCLCNWYTICTI